MLLVHVVIMAFHYADATAAFALIFSISAITLSQNVSKSSCPVPAIANTVLRSVASFSARLVDFWAFNMADNPHVSHSRFY
jgi:hypothetical protein